ncbi:MAG: Hpt domain-containing protein [Fuerstiella sp.]|nr:Hpt domain-containing protein [Fuerstiella sp.]
MNEQTILDEELLAAFFDEAQELLQDLPAGLRQFSENPSGPTPIHSVFRAIHTIKGNAGCFGMTTIKDFSHPLEHTLDGIRNGEVVLSGDLRRSLLDGFDLLDEKLNLALDGLAQTEPDERERGLLARIQDLAQTPKIIQSPESQVLEELRDLAATMQKTNLSESRNRAQQLTTLVGRMNSDTKALGTLEDSGEPDRRDEQRTGSSVSVASSNRNRSSENTPSNPRDSGGSWLGQCR